MRWNKSRKRIEDEDTNIFGFQVVFVVFSFDSFSRHHIFWPPRHKVHWKKSLSKYFFECGHDWSSTYSNQGRCHRPSDSLSPPPHRYLTHSHNFAPFFIVLNFSLFFSIIIYHFFSCPEQLNRWPCHWVTHLLILTLRNNPRDFWPLRHLIRVMRRHDLTQKDLPTYIPNHLLTYLPI